MKLFGDDAVVSLEIVEEGKDCLFVSENGLGKRTAFSEFNTQGRGGKGARGYKVTDKTGGIVGTESVSEGEEIMIITTEGIIIRMPVNTISQLGKTASGVKLINIDKESEARVASFTVIREEDLEGEESPEATENASSEETGENSTPDVS
jgi:DNA gyrase subunit A